ncbi:uncharacterized protein J4E87_010937 [Alternaria ethzedia]|uniref:uncharacterized protein n=1 Tax=Alternaria ethzedia TaxID=181014 RepID=UPI0020C3DE96|nr:uncharacterized protein J4E87_010937 [Alternaria ethzedia]KAI4609890.1 hypothetical protein J4E87_010937 [Alternaria ethzedia]
MPVSNVSRLSITLKLPLAFFQSVEGLSGNYPTSSDIGPATQPARLWQDLGSILSRFEALKKLDLWLDHNEPQFWVVVNERSTLDPLLTQLSTRPNLDVTVTLPMLHPKFEQNERHYTEDSVSENIRVNRVLRSKKHAVIGAQGCIENIDDLATFIEAYKQLQTNNTSLRNKLAERKREHDQTKVQLEKAAHAKYAAEFEAMREEMSVMRQDKAGWIESIEDLESEALTAKDKVATLVAEKSKLQRSVVELHGAMAGLNQTIEEGNKRFDEVKERVKAFATEL